jgi:hypothetical protein
MVKNLIYMTAVLALLLASCGKENPSRDEIPAIKDVLAAFQEAIYDKNPVRVDSLMAVEALDKNLDGNAIIAAVYGIGEDFYSFGQREFFYTDNRAVVKCVVMATQDDAGRPVEITLGKKGDRWLIRNLEFK